LLEIHKLKAIILLLISNLFNLHTDGQPLSMYFAWSRVE